MSKVTVTTGINEGDQEDSFQNATLQGLGDNLAVSIETRITVPPNIIEQGEAATSMYIEGVLMAAQPTKCNFKVIAINETHNWDPAIVQRAGGAIYGIYLYDALRAVNCCEITPSHELHLIGSQPASFIEDECARESLHDDLMAGDAQGDDVSYFHCAAIERMLGNGSAIAGRDFGEESAEEGYEVALEEKLEYVRGNDCAPALPNPKPEFYIWHGEGCCDNKTSDLDEAKRICQEFLDEGVKAYIADQDQNVIDYPVAVARPMQP